MAHQKIKYHGSPRRGTGFASHTKTLILGRAQNQLSPLPKIGEGLGEWSEAPSYEEGVGVDGGIAGFCLQWGLLRPFGSKRSEIERGVSPTGQRPEKK